MQTYPNITGDDLPDVLTVVRFIVRERLQDVTDFNNLPNVFMSGRRVGKIPSSSSDVVSTDKVNDFNITPTFAYFLVNNAGTAVWRRVALSSW